MPVIEGGKGKATDIAAWNGGGYAVSAKSEAKDEAIKFLNYMYQPDKLSKDALPISRKGEKGSKENLENRTGRTAGGGTSGDSGRISSKHREEVRAWQR